MSLRRFLQALRRDRRGAMAVEFALLGPLVLGLLLGVFQLGMGMQAYNAMRSASADVARYAVTNYQRENRVNNATIQTQATTIATSAPYNLLSGNLTVAAANAATQRVTGATEITLDLTYAVPNVLGVAGLGTITITYSRPIFVLS